MAIEDDISRVAEQERVLRFDGFDLARAWSLGARVRQFSQERGHVLAIDIRINGMQAFYAAMPEARPDFEHWIYRKRNTVQRFLRSSYAIGLELKAAQTTLEEKWGLPTAEYAAHGGAFPIRVNGVGCIGVITVSGLPQREDHNLVVEALAAELGLDHASLRLA
ncbi:heme-degrading domain-containing protein [Rhizobium sp. CSW-27]|uniref:heme-degrading domain-containing protein n=1 Tax=Rhizobium sp. CSW-27 TaxID=2839985 RepID=UPI001C01ABAD|nr:heme-degrading domain-containing protein [Rhizobium sp. CSW-27]MBT9370931.1 heme-degrading domain-containing protein [Rhizobium sp. CSW-27]